jgi:hypothetical protein
VIAASIRSALPLVLASTVGAADATLGDLRAGLGVLSRTERGGATTTVTDASGAVVSSTDTSPTPRSPDRNERVELQYVAGHLGGSGGIVYGITGSVNLASFSGNGTTTTFTTPVVDLLLGYGYAFLPRLHLELTPFAGFGWTYVDVTGDSQTNVKVDQHYLEYGARASLYWTFSSRWQLGVEVPYLVGLTNPDYSVTTSGNNRVSVSDERRNQGFGAIGQLGVRF